MLSAVGDGTVEADGLSAVMAVEGQLFLVLATLESLPQFHGALTFHYRVILRIYLSLVLIEAFLA